MAEQELVAPVVTGVVPASLEGEVVGDVTDVAAVFPVCPSYTLNWFTVTPEV